MNLYLVGLKVLPSNVTSYAATGVCSVVRTNIRRLPSAMGTDGERGGNSAWVGAGNGRLDGTGISKAETARGAWLLTQAEAYKQLKTMRLMWRLGSAKRVMRPQVKDESKDEPWLGHDYV